MIMVGDSLTPLEIESAADWLKTRFYKSNAEAVAEVYEHLPVVIDTDTVKRCARRDGTELLTLEHFIDIACFDAVAAWPVDMVWRYRQGFSL